MNHRKVLGWMFVVWAALQAIAAAVVMARIPNPPPAIALSFVVAAVFLWGAWRLLRSSQPAWLLGLGLSIAALLSFPVGTVIGAYGLFVALARPEQLGGAPRLPWRRQQV